MNERLQQVAALLSERNAIDAELARIIGRPPEKGHFGEWLAANILPLQPADSATQAGWDATFTAEAGELVGRTVNVKWYGRREGLLDMVQLDASARPDYYLIFAGPKSAAASSRGTVRPWCIASVHLFDRRALELELAGRKIGIATSVRQALWNAAEIFPEQRSSHLILTDEQRAALQIFRPTGEGR